MTNLTLPHIIEKPATGEGLILEAWAQGLLVGAFVIMAGITVANMRKGVLLHKLILIEVSPQFEGRVLYSNRLIAHLRDASRNIHFCKPACIWMVSFLHGHLPQHFMGDAQRNCMDEKQAILE